MPVKYPLTEKAKSAARILAELWQGGDIPQAFEFVDATAGNVPERKLKAIFVEHPFVETLNLGIIRELSEYRLIKLSEKIYIQSKREKFSWHVTLMQELINAVQSDFQVSDYFLTLNAVGTIISGDLHLEKGSQFQSVGINSGDITQTNIQIVENLKTILGQNFLSEFPSVEIALNEVKNEESSETLRQRLGNVILELGRSLQHGANTVVIVEAIRQVGEWLVRVL